jgi:hypothetical protein
MSCQSFHRIRHYGLLASANRAESIATARALLGVAPPAVDEQKPPRRVDGSVIPASENLDRLGDSLQSSRTAALLE